MENEIQSNSSRAHRAQEGEVEMRTPAGTKHALPASIVIAGIIIAGAVIYKAGERPPQAQIAGTTTAQNSVSLVSATEEAVLPSRGVVLPVTWGDLGSKLVSVGAIDANALKAIYDQRGAFTEEYRILLSGQNNGKLKITNENAGYLLNMFWALGLASKNPILDSGEMTNPAYGGAGNFASTGGWTISQGGAMSHYSRHKFFDLTPAEQALVEKVSRGIYRPCCGNSTHFPDCNHGMAMLGFLELMASQGVSEQEMWKAALAINSYWFPDTYLTIATYMKGKGIEWKDVNSEEMLGINYSSGQGYAKIAAEVATQGQERGGNGCGVDTGAPVAPQRQQGGCGI